MAFWLFILLNAVLFLRPAELVPALIGLPIYQFAIIASTIAALPLIIKQLNGSRLKRQPVTVCVLGMLAAVAMSHLSHLFFWGARYYTSEFSKTVLYYLIFIGVVSTARRLEQFFTALLIMLVCMAALSILQYRGVIYLPQLDSLTQSELDPVTGEVTTIVRLQSTGIFNDPNDFGMILVVGVVLCMHRLGRSGIFGKALYWALAAMFVYLIVLTKSRGAALALLAAMGCLVYAHWGWRRAMYAGCLLLPVVAAIFAMRDDGGVEEGTGQSRIQLWSEGFGLVKQYPLFGVGSNMFAEEIGLVAHNSFVHCYAELGLFGGTIFFGCFYFAFVSIVQQLKDPEIGEDPAASRRTATAFAILTGTFFSMLTLSRPYVVPPYMVLAIATVTARLNGARFELPLPRVSFRLAQRLTIASAIFVIATYAFVKVMVRWS